MEVGGIRVSHLSHIDTDLVLALTLTKGKKAPTRVKPLKVEPRRDPGAAAFNMDGYETAVGVMLLENVTHDDLSEAWGSISDMRKQAARADQSRATAIRQRVETRLSELSAES